jgi:hypothetical protein
MAMPNDGLPSPTYPRDAGGDWATRSQFLVASWKRQLIVDADPPEMIEQRHAERV